MKHWPI